MSARGAKYRYQICDPNSREPVTDPHDIISASNKIFECVLSALCCMNEGGSKLTYRAFLKLKNGEHVSYQPGESISIYAHNSETDVSWVLQRMGGDLQPDQVVVLKQNSAPRRATGTGPPVEKAVTPRLLIRHFLEIHTPVSRKTVQLLAPHCTKDEEKHLLLKMGGRDGIKLYDELIKNTSATLMDLLATFESCRPDLNTLLEVCPPFVARQYSLIDECKEASPQELNFAFSNVDFPKDLSNHNMVIEDVTFKRYTRKTGVSTGYIHKLWEEKLTGDSFPRIFISFRTNLNGFAHPERVSDPLIMISAGTGIAPFIGFLQQRRRFKQQSSHVGESWLFFGCRDPNYDLLFAEELAGFLEDSTLTHICLCFSRYSGDLPSKLPAFLRSKAIVPADCKYVQDCIASSCNSKKSVEDIADKLESIQLDNSLLNDFAISVRMVQLVGESGGHVRVCGDIHGMMRGVAEAWRDVFAQFKFADEEDPKKAAESYLMQLRKDKRYVEDAWL
nr:methionine synthase reductase [Hymenolepis microstoma]